MTQSINVEGNLVRELPVHAELVHDPEGKPHLRGWVTCPRQGPLDLEQCTSCDDCRGVLVKPHAGNVVLCHHDAARPNEDRERDEAVAWVSRPALAVERAMAAADVAAMMLEYDADSVLVVDHRGDAIGVITVGDVLRATFESALARRVAGDLMRPLPRPAGEDAPMAEVAARLADERVHAVPLRDAAGRVTSLLTGCDVAAWAADRARRAGP